MIKANELRIGNLILMAFENSIDTVTARTIGFINTANAKGHQHPFEPIPLTEEWLLKFGFSTHHTLKSWLTLYFNESDGTGIFYNSDNKLIYNGVDPLFHIKHVHQLQNLYHSLSGQELTIK